MGIPFGRYELLKRIAAGGMGEVFLARQAGLEGFEKLIVVKVLLPHLVEDEEFITMFLDEARIAARLNHPNVAQIFDLGSHEGAYYIAMEYIHGEDVVKIWKTARTREKPVPLALACRIACDAAAGLDYAHKATDSNGQPLGLVHRDVSPQNLLVTFDGGVKLIDFGVAKAAGRASRTATGTLKGKYSYMSPEQAGGRPIDNRSDVFALGVVLYEMATSLRLFKRETEVTTLKAVTECEIPKPSEKNPDIDPMLEGIILKALAREPENRYQDAQAMRLALEEWFVQTRQAGSAAHLAAYMQDLYAERLTEERAQGKPFSDFEGTPSSIFRRPGAALSAVGQGSQSHGSTQPATVSQRPPPKEPEAPKAKSKAPLFAAVGGVAALALGAAAFALWPRQTPPPAPAPAPAPAPLALLTITTRPAGASVSVDGTAVGKTPLEGHRLVPGQVAQVEVSLEGFKPVRRAVPAAGAQSIDLQLEPDQPAVVAPPAPEEVVFSLVSQPPGAVVSLGDKVIGETPLTYRHARSGESLTFQFKLAGYKASARTAAASADAEVKAVLAKAGGGGTKVQPKEDDPLDIKIGR